LATREEKLWQHHLQNKALRQSGAGKPARKAPRAEQVRRKNWASDALEDPDVFYEYDLPDRERIVPRGETERKSAYRAPVSPLAVPQPTTGVLPPAEAVILPDTETLIHAGPTLLTGTVVEVNAALCHVQLDGRTALCTVRNSLRTTDRRFTNVVAVGDEVTVSVNGDERGIVEAVSPRRSALARPDVFYAHLQQVIVANVDQLLIVASWREPALWPELLDRYLIAAERNSLAPIICVNKVDLADFNGEPQAVLAPYLALGYRVLFTSARTGAGLPDLRQALHNRTTALAGLSGVGKSSLLAMAEPGLNLRVAEVSTRHHEGRHTTSQVTLHPLSAGGFVVDTPGIREFGLSGLRRGDLTRHYAEIGSLAEGCRFPNCSHTREPDCAVRAAVRAGQVAAMRYDSYKKIYHSLAE
jgi:ribosome biogenesis GTPase